MHALLKDIDAVPGLRRFGRVARIEGLLVEVTGAAGAISLGGQVQLSRRAGPQDPVRSRGLPRRPGPDHAARQRGRREPGRARRFRRPAASDPSWDGMAWPRARRLRPTGRRQGPAAAGTGGLSHQGAAAIGPCPRTRRREIGAGGAGDERLRHLLPGPAHGHLRRLRRREIHAFGHDGAQYRRRRHRDRIGRRARPRAQGIHRGRSRRRRIEALGGGRPPPPTSRPWCAARRPMSP